MIHDIKELLDMLNVDGGHIVICIFMAFCGVILAILGYADLASYFIAPFTGALLLSMKGSGKANGVTKEVSEKTTTTVSPAPPLPAKEEEKKKDYVVSFE